MVFHTFFFFFFVCFLLNAASVILQPAKMLSLSPFFPYPLLQEEQGGKTLVEDKTFFNNLRPIASPVIE